MKDETVDIRNYQCRMISNKGKGSPIIFLHGYMFTSDVWNEIGLLRVLEQRNIPFKAVDMPYGKISECSPRTTSAEKNISIISSIAGKEPVLVGASLGGYIALKYSVTYPVRGLLLAAPVMSMQEDLVKHYPDLRAKVSIVYGDGDNIVSANEMKKLSRRFNTALNIYKNASHPAYLDYPERFVKDVLALYAAATENGASQG
ncbi:MAG: alpha/beta hydrolase [Desulfosalsimonadaceae bacterium]